MAGRFATIVLGVLLLDASYGLAHPASLEKIEILTRQIDARPTDQRLRVARGALYSHDGQYALAMADLREAEGLGDPIAVAYELGLLHHRMGKLALAKARLDEFLERFPRHTRAREQRARVHADLGDVAAAVADYEEVFATTPRPNPGLYIAAAKLLSSGENADVDRALGILDRGIDKLGMIPQLQQFAIELEGAHGRFERALERLASLESVVGDGPEWRVQMAELSARLEREKEARRHLDLASVQLSHLRGTPARRDLSRRINALRAILDAP